MNPKIAQAEIDVVDLEVDEAVQALSAEQLDLIGGGQCVLNGV